MLTRARALLVFSSALDTFPSLALECLGPTQLYVVLYHCLGA